ncbi:hypothetical protein N7539_000527 [Penicillium diatomitis]|uniref:Uncharacterized protein n=1 Tax=Penicillium diatomitis TaxID=2819901 RepID=A0A9W9XLU6_9EURO|nr:uncharacterized protein N7539_000527 [Penicillium diatomitis]KAJ5495411.1 hypothetical protein N7539_000527 [Penicillium diatomitis]
MTRKIFAIKVGVITRDSRDHMAIEKRGTKNQPVMNEQDLEELNRETGISTETRTQLSENETKIRNSEHMGEPKAC